MTFEPIQYVLGLASGGLVGFSLGLVGGGGSILAVPLMVYVVGVPSAHVAIGTSALAVAANAATGLANHASAHNVKWRCGGIFAASGIVGAALGSTFGKMVDGDKLLFLFALVMLVVGALMLKRRGDPGDPGAECTREKAPKVASYGLGSGLFSGFFGIGGGFLIVPGLVASTGMPILLAVGTSLVAVTAFGLTTAANYAFSGLIDWPLALLFIVGGAAGSFAGTRLARRLGASTGRLTIVFASLIFAVAVYMLWKSGAALFA
ncbi:MAG: sulfite exporter TauE/SafE family protein [Sphingobium sp.]